MYGRFMCAASALALVFCLNSAPMAQEGEDPVIAVVDDHQIFMSDVMAARASLPEQYSNAPVDQLFGPLRDRLIDTYLMSEKAIASGLDEDPDLARAIQHIRSAMLRDALIQKEIETTITEDRLRAAYEERKGQEGFANEEVHARHILVESEEEAKNIITELDGGADFVELAKEHSTGPSGPNGGDLGYFNRETMVPEFAEAAFTMEPGTYTENPVQTQFGWHIILVEDKRQSEPTFAEMQADLTNELTAEVMQNLVASVREDAAIELFNADGTPE